MARSWNQPSAQIFEQQYLCYALSPYGEKSRLEDGNRVILPASALDCLASLHIEYPMVFSVQDSWSNDRISHCGVLEFNSEEGIILMPNWMIANLGTLEGQLVTLKSTSLPKGTYMKIQPHSTKFIQGLSNPKVILEGILKDFSCITTGDTIAISYQGESYKINILETKPSNAISLIETDCEVDFAQPLDYKEPPPPLPVKTCCPKPAADNQEQEDVRSNAKSLFRAFTGSARRLDGRTSQPDSTWPVVASKDVVPGTSTSSDNSGNMVSTRKRENNTEAAIRPKMPQEAEPNSKLFKPFSGPSRSFY